MGLEPLQHQHEPAPAQAGDAEATEGTAFGSPLPEPPIPPRDCDHRVDGIEPSCEKHSASGRKCVISFDSQSDSLYDIQKTQPGKIGGK
jgi:hypothetical protein